MPKGKTKHLSTQEVADILEIDLFSAEELMEGIIEFEVEEAYAISLHTGMTLQELRDILLHEDKA